MGEAKRRGTRDQRIAQAIERRKVEEAQRAEERARVAAERRRQASERQRLLTPEERKEQVMLAGGGARLGLSALMALTGAALATSDRLLVLDDRSGGDLDR